MLAVKRNKALQNGTLISKFEVERVLPERKEIALLGDKDRLAPPALSSTRHSCHKHMPAPSAPCAACDVRALRAAYREPETRIAAM